MLSKSAYLAGLSCPKKLYLNKNHSAFSLERPPITPMQQSLFDTGHYIGHLAQQRFPGGVDLTPEDFGDLEPAIANTKAAMESGEKILYEASFEHDGVYCAVDIMVKRKGKWHAYEVKATGSVKEEHHHDTAVQWYVMQGAGVNLLNIYLMHVNTSYTRQGKLDVDRMFKIEGLKKRVLAKQGEVKKTVGRLKRVLTQDTLPKQDIGAHCLKPHDCIWKDYCWQHIGPDSVFEISGMNQKDKFELYSRKKIYMKDLTTKQVREGLKAWTQIDGVKSGKEEVHPRAIKNWLGTLKYPLYYFDFETYQPAAPIYDGTRPYQQIPFQFSLHIQNEEGGKLDHHEFLGNPAEDPRQKLLTHFLKLTEGVGSIVTYNQSFEIGRLKELGHAFPKYKKQINNRIKRIVDLEVPFKKHHYYTPAMKGRSSIKAVYPALVGDKYNSLNIADGKTASVAYLQLINETDEKKIERVRTDLLAYCKLDTEAMVEILDVLRKLVV